MRKMAALVGMAALALAYPLPGFSQSSEEFKALRQEVQRIQEGQATIQKELQAIRELLQRAQAPAPAQAFPSVLSVEGAPFKGDKNAKVTLIEFTDYQCPFCARHFRDTLSQIDKEYVQTGKIRYVLRDFPLESIHPHAFKAAEAAHCAGEQGKYWETHDRLFADQKALALKDLPQHAQALGLDGGKFQQCLDGGKYAAQVRKDLAEGQKAGVTGTPSFFLGIAQGGDSQVKVERALKGAQPYAAFKDAIDSLLSAQK